MWHEVRKQERKIRCMIVDYKRRAERRKDYYEKIKADPTQFLQIHGRPCKIHLDPSVAMAGDSPAIMMGWQGNSDVMIDRFDVRAHLDYIEDHQRKEDEPLSYEDRHVNYERYRILVQNDFLGVSEEKFLHQLYLEEQFGVVTRMPEVPNEGKKKVQGAAIGFNYEDPLLVGATIVTPVAAPLSIEIEPEVEEEEDEDSDIDFDVCVDVNKVTMPQAHEMNSCALPYGMESNDFFSFLTKDREEAETLRLAKELEEEKAMYSGRKSRRERRAYREKKLAGRIISPPSYASRKSPTYRDYTREGSKSRSRSNSPVNSGKITYITSFGGEEHQPSNSSPKLKSTPKTLLNEYSRALKHKSRSPDSRRSHVRSHSRSPGHSRRRRTKSRSPRNTHRSPRCLTRPLERSLSKSNSPIKANTSANVPLLVQLPPPPVITRYYGRRGQSSSSELSLSDEDTNRGSTDDSVKKVGAPIGNSSCRNKVKWEEDKVTSSETITRRALWNNLGSQRELKCHVTNAGALAVPGPSSTSFPSKLTPQERLKRKMQALINKQYKADKKAEREKKEKVEQERIDREDEMREISIKLRKRERMRRHEYLAEYERRKSDSSGSSCSPSPTRSRSRSNSGSPPLRREREKDTRSRSRSQTGRRDSKELELRDKEHESKDKGRTNFRHASWSRHSDNRERERGNDHQESSRNDSREKNYDPRAHEKSYDSRDHSRGREREREKDRDRERGECDRESDRDRDKNRYHDGRSIQIRSLVDY